MILIVAGTNRLGSLSSRTSHSIAEIYRTLGQYCEVLELSELPPETFSPTAYVQKPSKVLEFTDKVLQSSGLVVVSPEYNGSMSGALKLFIDLLPYPESFENRPICYVGIASGQFGALRPVEHLQQVFGYRNAHNFPKRVFVPAVHEVIDKDKGVQDESLTDRLRDQAVGFIDFCKALGKSV